MSEAPAPPLPLPTRGTLQLRARAVGERIDTASLSLGDALVRRPLVATAGERGLALVFR